MSRQILVIEDNPDIADLLNLHLKDLGGEVTNANDGLEGLKLGLTGRFQLIILDLMLPSLDGIALCQKLRNEGVFTPILMLTAKTGEIDRVLGLEVGADDYLTKPFSIRELIARVKALFRRVDVFNRNSDDEKHELEFQHINIDLDERMVRVRDRLIDLTAKEYDLLLHFASNPGRVYTRSQLLDSVWGYGHDGYEHTVNSHINRLRSKIEHDPTNPEFILTVWGVGYKFNREQEAA